ncbi:MAG: O-antigen ligase family protein [Actinomycetota bacterium]|nr:O-antigen ligase family protein [Actinomycetota bacterium]
MARAVAAPRGLVQRRRAFGLPLVALLGGFALWWALGLGGFIWPILAVPMLGSLLVMDRVRLPRGFGLYALFLFWVLMSATQLEGETSRMIVFAYRFSLYVAAGVTFLYVYNASSELLPARRVTKALVALWTLIVAGGFLGMLLGGFSMHSFTEQLMPGSFLGDKWVHDMVHIEFAEGVGLRPNAPFTYTNEWGANFALLAPFAFFAMGAWKQRPGIGWPILVALSFIPLLLSTNRGAWISLGGGILYVTVALVVRGRARALAGLVLLIGVVLGLVIATPLGTTLENALAQRESTESRFNIYEQTGAAVLDSPLFGFGAPRPNPDPSQPPLGTHGQLWMVTFSHGIPGGLLYITFLLSLFFQTRRSRSRLQFFCHMAIVIAIIQLPFYAALPGQIFVVMIAAGLALRERDAGLLEPREEPPFRQLALEREPISAPRG